MPCGPGEKGFGSMLTPAVPHYWPFYRFFLGEGSPTKIDYREKCAYTLTSLLQDLAR